MRELIVDSFAGEVASPYALPDGPVAIQFSGGRTSAYMLRHILDAHDGQLPPDCHVLFQNTGREMPETLDFVQECGTRWGVRIVWIEYRDKAEVASGYEVVSHNSASRNGEPFAALIRKRKFLPNQQARFCTQELKVIPAKRWLLDRGYQHWSAAIGIRADERRRAKATADPTHTCFWPLIDAGVSKRDVGAWWSAQPFDLNLPNVNGSTPLGNCDGCFLRSERVRAFLARYYPQRAAWWDGFEQEIGAETPNGYARFDRRMSWSALIAHAEQQADWVFDEGAGMYCETGFGGCHD